MTNQFIPHGTIKIKNGNGLYVDKTEVLNSDWTDYIGYLEKKYGKSSIEYETALPDSLVWHSVYSSGRIDKYNTQFANFPITGITYEQAVNYCYWCSDRVREKYGKSVTYRLPTRNEWNMASKAVLRKNYFFSQNKLVEVNRKVNTVINMQNNVSEMIAEKGVALGINWAYLDTFTKPITCDGLFLEFEYKTPVNYIGFRCVAIIN